MWYYIKQAIIPFIYLIFMAITALGILCIGDNLLWLKIALLILNLALYVVIVFATSYKDGQDALKVRVMNDLERKQIVETGESLPLKLKEEYKPWKGFFSGFIACIPLIVLLIVHTILIFALGDKYVGAGAVAGFIYMIVFAFSRVNLPPVVEGEPVIIDPFIYYYSLFAIPVIMLTTGIAYILGARKIELQQEKIKEKQRRIYGE